MVEILFENRDIVAFIKPAGMLSQKSESGEASVLEELNVYACGKWECYPVHRLDRTTGGVMLCAKNSKAAAVLSEGFASGEIKKEYLACVHGKPEDEGILENFLFFDRRLNKSFVVKETKKGAKNACLRYERLCTVPHPAGETSLMKIKLYTGRTHQIRIQMSNAGHPLLGDGKYGGRDNRAQCALWSHKITVGENLAKRSVFRGISTDGEFVSTPNGYPFDLFI